VSECLISINYKLPFSWQCHICGVTTEYLTPPADGITKAGTDHLRECRKEKVTS
jgi:hypothetical protein